MALKWRAIAEPLTSAVQLATNLAAIDGYARGRAKEEQGQHETSDEAAPGVGREGVWARETGDRREQRRVDDLVDDVGLEREAQREAVQPDGPRVEEPAHEQEVELGREHRQHAREAHPTSGEAA
jgi:hypothetical protein